MCSLLRLLLRLTATQKARFVDLDRLASEIAELWTLLGLAPSERDSQVDTAVAAHCEAVAKAGSRANLLNAAPATRPLPLTTDALQSLKSRKQALSEERDRRQQRLDTAAKEIRALWDKLELPVADRPSFVGTAGNLATSNLIQVRHNGWFVPC